LIKDLILDNSNEGDLIFDPCVGSGSHLLCAKELNRNYIGCELDKKYFKIAKDRLDN
jgi:site-specific DNA-methyltransferase (adenine-specific)